MYTNLTEWLEQMPDFRAAVQQAVLENLPVDRKLMHKAHCVFATERARRVTLCLLGTCAVVSLAGMAGRRMLYRSAVSREVKRQLADVHQKLDDLQAQNAQLLRQNEALLTKLEPEAPEAEAPEPEAQD